MRLWQRNWRCSCTEVGRNEEALELLFSHLRKILPPPRDKRAKPSGEILAALSAPATRWRRNTAASCTRYCIDTALMARLSGLPVVSGG